MSANQAGPRPRAVLPIPLLGLCRQRRGLSRGGRPLTHSLSAVRCISGEEKNPLRRHLMKSPLQAQKPAPFRSPDNWDLNCNIFICYLQQQTG